MRNILCLDDSRIALKSLERSLKKFGHIIFTTSIPEAIKAMDKFDISLFVVDYLLIDGNGIDFVRDIRKIDQYKKTPIILISAALTTEIAYNAMRFGVNQSLSKPIEKEKLQKIIEEQLKSPSIHNVEKSYSKFCCMAWENNGTYYEYSPDIQITVHSHTKEGAHSKMNDLLTEQLDIKNHSIEEIIGLELVHHTIKKQ